MQSAKTTPQAAQLEVTGKTFYPRIPQIGPDFLREARWPVARLFSPKDGVAVGILLADAQEPFLPYYCKT